MWGGPRRNSPASFIVSGIEVRRGKKREMDVRNRTTRDKAERAMDKVKAAEHDIVSLATRPEYIR